MDSKTEKYLKIIEGFEIGCESDAAMLGEICRDIDMILQKNDVEQLERLVQKMMQDNKELVVRHASLLRLQELTAGILLEKSYGGPLFLSDTDSFGELMDKYERVNQYLRRIELDVEPGLEEGYTYIREHSISPFVTAGILYHMTSRIGHRESVLMKLADDALEHGDALRAYCFLSVIREPSEDVIVLKDELGQAIESVRDLS